MIWLLISAWFLFGFILAVGVGKIIHHIDKMEPHVDKTWRDRRRISEGNPEQMVK